MPTEFDQLRKEFFEKLLDLLKPYGFKFIKSRTLYIRKTEYGFDDIYISWASYGINFSFNMDIGVRYEIIETLYDKYLHIESRSKYRDTIGNRLDNMFKSSEWYWTISNRFDMEMAVPNMMDTIQKVAFPYFERFSTLEAIADILWRDDAEAIRLNMKKDIPFQALAAAYLLNRRDMFEAIVVKHAEKLRLKAEDFKPYADIIARYYNFIDDLRAKWVKIDS
ncbi:MAG: hypothetical protein ACYC27_15550 [Armatimonadota bacterium]